MSSTTQLSARISGRLKHQLVRGAAAVQRRVGSPVSETTIASPDPAATIAAFQALPSDLTYDVVVNRFHELYYLTGLEHRGTWWTTQWLGTTTWKCPLDLWLYQEIVHELRPDLIIETGTAHGGSAAYLGALCDLVENGQIVSIDISPQPNLPVHPRVRYIEASSTDPEIVAEVARLANDASTVLVILDSDHSKDHVFDELRAYAPFVTPGSYVIVEDSNVNGHPVWPDFGPGPMEALEQFLTESADFEIDPRGDKFLLTFNPRGLLKRKS